MAGDRRGATPIDYTPRFHFIEGGGAVCVYREDVAYDDLAPLDADGPRHRLYLGDARLGVHPRLSRLRAALTCSGWGVTPQVGLDRLPALRELRLGVLVGDGRAMITSSPSFQFTGVDTL